MAANRDTFVQLVMTANLLKRAVDCCRRGWRLRGDVGLDVAAMSGYLRGIGLTAVVPWAICAISVWVPAPPALLTSAPALLAAGDRRRCERRHRRCNR